MAIKRMDHTTLVVCDLDAAVEYFTVLGMEVEGRASVSGETVSRILGEDDVASDIAMMITPDSQSRLELTRFRSPDAVELTPWPPPPHVLGWTNVMFEVDDIRDTVARLEPVGGTLLGDIVDYEGVYLLAYVRGPEGVVVALAEALQY
jgi:catechol 2,3-dioxygenase-like lactoylglutathione lyase family enzyme